MNLSRPSPDQSFRITIIGSVDQRRRNYEPVIEAFRQLTPLLNRPVILSLLGKSAGKYATEVIQKLKSLGSDNFKLESFDEVVPQDVFDAVMSNTHLILSPVNLKNSTEIFGEIYGQTKISGSLLDVLRFPKITILPAGYNLDGIFKNYFDQYSDPRELKDIMLKFITQEHLVDEKTALIKKIIESKFTASTLANQFVSTIKTLSLPK
ncbi:MAG: hypothetical protein WCK09_01980 [Bacteroidota bacterium]